MGRCIWFNFIWLLSVNGYAQGVNFGDYLFSRLNCTCDSTERDSVALLARGWESHYCVHGWQPSVGQDRVNYDVLRNDAGQVVAFKVYSDRSQSVIPIISFAEDESGRVSSFSIENDLSSERIWIALNEAGRPRSLVIGGDMVQVDSGATKSSPKFTAEWHDNGQLRHQHYLDSSKYEIKTYYPSGAVSSIGRINKGYQYKGRYVEYFESGEISVAGNFQNVYAENENWPIRVGTWHYWTEQGCLYREEDYSTSTTIEHSCK